nr:aminotransferase class V-fold PLP-dependent enzyme [Erythrobacter crassostrea]
MPYRNCWSHRPAGNIMRIDDTIYLDYQAATPIDPRVLAGMTDAFRRNFANPHATDHFLGRLANDAIEHAAIAIANCVGAFAEDIVFTSGATEANALALTSARSECGFDRHPTIVTCGGDHKSVIDQAHHFGLNVRTIELDSNGAPDIDHASQIIDGETALVSVIGVNNENGAITDLASIGAICAETGTLFHADLSQSLSSVPIDIEAANLSYATLSSQKAYGPKGIGALVVDPKARARLSPLLVGGGQQDGLRGGTMPTELCVGFGIACDLIREERKTESSRLAILRDRLVNGIEAAGWGKLLGDRSNRHPGNALIELFKMSAFDLLSRAQPKIAASTRSSCSSSDEDYSHVLRAMGLGRERAERCVRFSLGRFSDEKQIDEVLATLDGISHDIAERD